MIRSELVLRVAEMNPQLYAREIEAVVDVILDRIATALADGGRVELRDFGAFSVKSHLPRTARNPRTGATVEVGGRTSVHFKPGKAIRERLNFKPDAQEREAKRPAWAS